MNELIVTVVPIKEEDVQRLRCACPSATVAAESAETVTDEQLSRADIIFGNLPPARLSACKQLRFLQLESAGYDNYTVPGVLPAGTIVANATGAYGIALSEHMLAALLAVQKNLYGYWEAQKEGRWADGGDVGGIYGARALVIGAGDIGTQMALRLSAMGAKVKGIKWTVSGPMPHFAQVFEFRSAPWKELLSEADIVVISAPLTEETRHLIDEEKLHMMKPQAILVNGGRGGIVDTQALCDALESGRLAAAILDVTDPEPLPKDHRLWTVRGAYITPHIAGGHHFQETTRRIAEIGIENIRRFSAGEPVSNQVWPR